MAKSKTKWGHFSYYFRSQVIAVCIIRKGKQIWWTWKPLQETIGQISFSSGKTSLTFTRELIMFYFSWKLMDLTKYNCCPNPQGHHTKFWVPFPVHVHMFSWTVTPGTGIMFTSVNENLGWRGQGCQPLAGFNEVRANVPGEGHKEGPSSSPGKLVSRPSLGAWLWVVGQPLWVPTLLKGDCSWSMISWLIKAFPPLVEGWKLEYCLQWKMRKNKQNTDRLTRSI